MTNNDALQVDWYWQENDIIWAASREDLNATIVAYGNKQERYLPMISASAPDQVTWLPGNNSPISLGARVLLSAGITSLNDAQGIMVEVNNHTTQLSPIAPDLFLKWQKIPNDIGLVSGDFVEIIPNVNDQAGLAFNWQLIENNADENLLMTKPINNQRFYEGDPLVINYQVDKDELRYVFIELTDFNGNSIWHSELVSAKGNLTIKLPTAIEQSVYKVNITAFYGEEYRSVLATRSIRITPRVEVKPPELSGLGSRIIFDSYLHAKVTTPLLAGQKAVVTVYDQAGKVLASQNDEINFLVDESVIAITDKQLQVVVRVYDSYGNLRSKQYDLKIVKPFKLTANSQQESVVNHIPMVGDDLVWQDRVISNSIGDILFETESKILDVITHLDRLLVLTENNNLEFVDPEESYSVVGRHSIEGESTFDTLITKGDRLLVQGDNVMQIYSVQGNEIQYKYQRRYESNIINTGFYNDNVWIVNEDHWYLYDTETGRRQHDLELENISSVLQQGNNWWLVSHSGQWIRLTDSGQVQNYPLKVRASKLLAIGGFVLAFYDEKATVVDIRWHSNLQVAGYFSMPNITPNSHIELTDGALLVDSARYQISYPIGEKSTLIEPERPYGIIADLTMSGGDLWLARDHYGAEYLQSNENSWKKSSYPSQPYTEGVDSVAINEDHIFYGQLDHRRIAISSRWQSEKSVIGFVDNIAPEKMITLGDWLYISNADEIVLLPIDEKSINKIKNSEGDINRSLSNSESNTSFASRFVISENENVIGFTVQNGVVYASTDQRNLYRITVDLPAIDEIHSDSNLSIMLLDDDRFQSELILQADYAFEELTGNNQVLAYVLNETVTVLNLSNLKSYSLALNDAVDITSLKLEQGILWGAYRTLNEARIFAYDINKNQFINSLARTVESRVYDITQDESILAFSRGESGLTVEEIALADLSIDTGFTSPSVQTTIQQGDLISLAWNSDSRVTAQKVWMNDKLFANMLPGQNIARIVPAYLKNGQAVTIRTDFEMENGGVINGLEQQLFLHGQELPANNFKVSLRIDSSSYLPAPMKIRASVSGSSQPIEQVEYYIGDSADGAFELIGKHYGPEYVIYRNYGPDRSGDFIKVRAVDIYGNTSESDAVSFNRLLDMSSPEGSIEFSGDPVLNQYSVIGGHNFNITAKAADDESGVQSALLYRDDTLISALFENGEIAYFENPLQANTAVNYSWTVTDFGQNKRSASKVLQVIEDTRPVISEVMLLNSMNREITRVREGSSFKLKLTAKDDVGLSNISVQFGNQIQVAQLNGKLDEVDFTFVDNRATRVVEGEVAPLTITLHDNGGQVNTIAYDVIMAVDQQPELSKGLLDFPKAAYYSPSEQQRLKAMIVIDDVFHIDDSEILNFYLLPYSDKNIYDTNNALSSNTYTRGECLESKSKRCYKTLMLETPLASVINDQVEYVVIAEDSLGQKNISEVFVIQYSLKPNRIRFEANNDPALNRELVSVSNDENFRVQVMDSVNRGVAQQEISWTLKSMSGEAEFDLGNSISLKTYTVWF